MLTQVAITKKLTVYAPAARLPAAAFPVPGDADAVAATLRSGIGAGVDGMQRDLVASVSQP